MRCRRLWREAADLVIEPDVAGFAYDDFKRAKDLIRVGEVAMQQALPEVRKWLAAPEEIAVNARTNIRGATCAHAGGLSRRSTAFSRTHLSNSLT